MSTVSAWPTQKSTAGGRHREENATWYATLRLVDFRGALIRICSSVIPARVGHGSPRLLTLIRK